MKRLICTTHDTVASVRSLFGEKGQITDFAELMCPNGHSEVAKSPRSDSTFEQFEWREQSSTARTLDDVAEDPQFTSNERALVYAANQLLTTAFQKHGLYVRVTDNQIIEGLK